MAHRLASEYTNWRNKAVYLYDYVLTFSDEVDQLWMSERSGTAALFCTLRYPPLVNVVLQILLLLPWKSWQTSHVSNVASL